MKSLLTTLAVILALSAGVYVFAQLPFMFASDESRVEQAKLEEVTKLLEEDVARLQAKLQALEEAKKNNVALIKRATRETVKHDLAGFKLSSASSVGVTPFPHAKLTEVPKSKMQGKLHLGISN